MLEKLVNDKFNVYNLNCPKSQTDTMSALKMIMDKEDKKMFEILVDPKLNKNSLNFIDHQLRQEFYVSSRRVPKPLLLKKLQQG